MSEINTANGPYCWNLGRPSSTTIGWERQLPFGGTTERYQVLEPSIDGNKTISTIALKIPGPVGFFSKTFLEGTIKKSFEDLNNGIKEAAENSSALTIIVC